MRVRDVVQYLQVALPSGPWSGLDVSEQYNLGGAVWEGFHVGKRFHGGENVPTFFDTHGDVVVWDLAGRKMVAIWFIV